MRPRPFLAAILHVLCCELCLAIRVPIWSDSGNSDVKNEKIVEEFSVENFKPENVYGRVPTTAAPAPIPTEYFEYTAKKPDFAVEVAAFHGVKSPEKHYHAYPVEPYTGLQKPVLGQHHILDKGKTIYKPFQKFAETHEGLKSHVAPASSNYEVFHPYKAEEPALEEVYKDPVLDKIRNDLRHASDRLKKYENDAGEPNISKDEYLESPEETERKKFQPNEPNRFEVHRPHRRPAYYRRPPKFMQRDRYLNKKFRHPLYQDYVKIKPVHYRPLKQQLHNFRQKQAYTYGDEKNEYPQLPPPQNFAEPLDDGYDIYEQGKSRYVNLRNNIDGAINHAVLHNRPTTYQKLEQLDDSKYSKGENYYNPVPYDDNIEDDEVTTEFVPIKSYAQVRKTETTRHLPKEAAFEDAENFEELKNAPRLREAVKSTKAQTVYTEEGYEDGAYDHEGEQKHASDHEGHGGYLKEHELSGGRYRIPSVSASYSDGGGSVSGDKTHHGEKWKNDDNDSEEEKQDEDYTDDDHEKLLEANEYDDVSGNEDQDQDRSKREESKENSEEETKSDEVSEDSEKENEPTTSESVHHDVIKREVEFKIPELDLNKTFFTEKDYANVKKQNIFLKKDEVKEKYPYYFKNLDKVHKNSPLRYAENLRLIPKKTRGGTEFYDSRSDFVCPEVDDEVDPIPEKIKNNSTATDSSEDTDELKRKKRQATDETKKTQRLRGLGDKIDCFKAKYFGENPLDSPFFKEEIISNPDPIPFPNIASFKIIRKENVKLPELTLPNVSNITVNVKGENEKHLESLLESLKQGQLKLQDSLKDDQSKFLQSSILTQSGPFANKSALLQASVYTDIIDNIRKKVQKPLFSERVGKQLMDTHINGSVNSSNVNYNSFLNKESVTKLPLVRKRRAVFMYEPYKIIRDGQLQDSKKTTTAGNISPLIRQLQSSKVVDKVTLFDNDQPVKRNVALHASRSYKDIGRKERQNNNKEPNDSSDSSQFVNVNVDKRRGEPRYELKPPNHKSLYTPVDNKKALTIEEYESLTNKKDVKLDSIPTHRARENSREEITSGITTSRPVFDVNKYLPQRENQELAASRTVHRVIRTTTPAVKKATKQETIKQDTSESSETDDDEYEEYDDSEEENPETTSTTTTTVKPAFRRKIRVTTTTTTTTSTTTPAPRKKSRKDDDQPTKLRLITRFNKPPLSEEKESVEEMKETPPVIKDKSMPKYREKTKKTSKSTLVTDTNSYGEDNDDEMKKDEVDAMMKIEQDMDDYVPTYEKEIENKEKKGEMSVKGTGDDNNDEDYEDEEDDESDEDEDESDEDYDDEQEESQAEETVVVTTPEPVRRTLLRTTEAPVSTTEARIAKIRIKPVVVKKKIEIHKELPVNKSSPHLSKFEQDIKEEEIIKELPRKKSNKNIEALELYRDDELAKKVNKLSEVEVFKENLDVRKGPRHGGNYKSAKIVELKENHKPIKLHGGNLKAPKKEEEDAQSEDTKVVQFDEDDIPVRKSQTRTQSRTNIQRPRGKYIELVESSDKIVKPKLHGGNLKLKNIEDEPKSEKLIELDEDEQDDSSDDSEERTHESTGNSGRSLHGGNYRSGKLVQAKTNNVEAKGDRERKVKESVKDGRADAAKILNSFVQAVPILTSTPAYILDPSKRMYYYVDA